MNEQSWYPPDWRDLIAFVFISTCWVPPWDLWKSTRNQVRPEPRYFPSTVTKEISGTWRRFPWRVQKSFRWLENVYSTKFSLLQGWSRLSIYYNHMINYLCWTREKSLQYCNCLNCWPFDRSDWYSYSRSTVTLGYPGGNNDFYSTEAELKRAQHNKYCHW